MTCVRRCTRTQCNTLDIRSLVIRTLLVLLSCNACNFVPTLCSRARFLLNIIYGMTLRNVAPYAVYETKIIHASLQFFTQLLGMSRYCPDLNPNII